MRTASLLPALTAASAVVAAAAGLFLRLAPDVRGKPLFVDETVAALIAMRPLRELVSVVLFERGGAPGHFVVAHAALAVHSSADSLRWLSVLFAVLTVPLAYDLGRRLAGLAAGAVAAFVVAASQSLAVYGTFGRMYSLFAFVAALAVDLFVRALEHRTPSAIIAAAAAAWLVPAVHPYGVLLLGAEVLVALVVWRGRPFRFALLLLALVAATAPFMVSNMRLAGRFSVGGGEARLLGIDEGARYFGHVLAEFAGGRGPIFVLALLLALIGARALLRSNAAFVAVTAVATALPLVLLMATPTARTAGLANLSTRHLIYVLPMWAALVAVGAASALRRLPRAAIPGGVAALAAALFLASPSIIRDPRTRLVLVRESGTRHALEPPARWLRGVMADGDALFYPSPLFLASLPDAGKGHLLAPAPGGLLGRSLDRIVFPVPGAAAAAPLGDASIDPDVLRRDFGRRARVYVSPSWLVIRLIGPFDEPRPLLRALHRAFRGFERTIERPPPRLSAYLRSNIAALCSALRQRGERCA